MNMFKLVFAFVFMALLTTSNVRGAVVTFSNRDAAFVLVPNGFENTVGSFFNPSLPPQSQPASRIDPFFTYSPTLGGASTSVGADVLVTHGALALVRSVESVVVNGPMPGQQTFFRPAASLPTGSVVGAGLNFESGVIPVGYFGPQLGRFNFLGSPAFVGFRITLADGLPHYGYIEFEYTESMTASGIVLNAYQPRFWAYESLPNTPITIVPTPPGIAVLAAAGIVGLRRSRRGD